VTSAAAVRDNEQKLQRALGVRYKWERFNDIRSDEDFAKGAGRNKARVIETKFVSQPTPLPKSMTVLDKANNKVALKINKAVLGYCGDKVMSFAAALARDVLQKGADHPALADEIYIQLCKHATKNPKPDSAGRAWQLACMCVATFPPSPAFEPHLLNFLQSNVNVPGLVGNYARFALRRLEGMLVTGPTGFVPSVDEIAAYKDRPPILATIYLVDGTVLTQGLPVTPDLDAGKVADLCVHFLGIKDPRCRHTFAIFVVDEAEQKRMRNGLEAYYSGQAAQSGQRPKAVDLGDLYRTPRALAEHDSLGTVVVQMTRAKHEFSFVFKRKLHLGILNDKPSEDLIYRRLMYLQGQDAFISGDVPLNNVDEIVSLMAMCVAADNEAFPETVDEMLTDVDVISYVPRPVRRAKTDRDWAKAVLSVAAAVREEPSQYLQDKFVDLLKRNELYGASYFWALRCNDGPNVITLPVHCLIALNALGLHVIDGDARRRGIVRTVPFQSIKKWGGPGKLFSVVISKPVDRIAEGAESSGSDYNLLAAMDGAGGGGALSGAGKSHKNLLRAASSQSIALAAAPQPADARNTYELQLSMPQAADLAQLMTEYVTKLVGVGDINQSIRGRVRSRKVA